MNVRPNIIIFSVFQNKNNELDLSNHKEVVDFLKTRDVKFKEIEGFYKGRSEKAFLVMGSRERLVLDICKKYNKDTYLFSHGSDRVSELVNVKTGARKKAGVLKPVPDVEGFDSYAYDAVSGTYWATVKEKAQRRAHFA